MWHRDFGGDFPALLERAAGSDHSRGGKRIQLEDDHGCLPASYEWRDKFPAVGAFRFEAAGRDERKWRAVFSKTIAVKERV